MDAALLIGLASIITAGLTIAIGTDRSSLGGRTGHSPGAGRYRSAAGRSSDLEPQPVCRFGDD